MEARRTTCLSSTPRFGFALGLLVAVVSLPPSELLAQAKAQKISKKETK